MNHNIDNLEGEEETDDEEIPKLVLEGDRVHPASVALALTGLIARPTIGKA
jgi:hypothetical protein